VQWAGAFENIVGQSLDQHFSFIPTMQDREWELKTVGSALGIEVFLVSTCLRHGQFGHEEVLAVLDHALMFGCVQPHIHFMKA
jgi:hypothetical protein